MASKRNEYKYEKSVLERINKALGSLFRSQPGSGSGWLKKEDGEDKWCLLQIKSTQAKQIVLKLDDVQTLLANSYVSHKIPVFAVDIQGTTLLCVQPEDLKKIAKYYDQEIKNG